VEKVTGQVWEYFKIGYEKLQAGRFKEIDSAYFNNLFRANEWALFAKQGEQFEAKIIGIGEFGQLILEDRNGTVSKYMFKELEFVI